MGTKMYSMEPISVFFFFFHSLFSAPVRTTTHEWIRERVYTYVQWFICFGVCLRIFNVCVFIVLKVKVTILDKNDNRPMWPSTPIEYKISEEIPIGSTVATLKATDPDLDSTLTYMIIGDDDNSSPLILDAYTGIVRVRKPIDRETSPRHVLPVRVSDGIHDSDTSVLFIVSITTIFNVSE